MTRLVVVGGGISGLAAAWEAARAGFDVTLLEAAPAVGGKLRSEQVAGVAVDVGAEAMLAARPEGRDLLGQLGLDGETVAPLTTAARIRAGGRDHPMPARTAMGVPGDLGTLAEAGLLTPAGLAAVAAEPDLPPLAPLEGDVAVGPFVRERMGAEVVDRLIEPLLGGVYAGRADELSLRATLRPLAARLADAPGEDGGSLLAAAAAVAGSGTRAASADGPPRPVFLSLRGGLGRLPQALAGSGRFTVRCGTTVRAITRTPDGFALDVGAVPASERLTAQAVVVAVPAGKAARLLGDVAPHAAGDLAGIRTASTAIVTFAFRTPPPLAGSGLLVAAGERLAVKAVTLSSAKWPIGADGLFLLRASVGRVDEPLALQLDDEGLTELALRELRALLGDLGEPVDSLVTRWGGGLPQYDVGHLERVGRIRAAVARVPGLAVCGAYLDGLGIPACIGAARAAVDTVDAVRSSAASRADADPAAVDPAR